MEQPPESLPPTPDSGTSTEKVEKEQTPNPEPPNPETHRGTRFSSILPAPFLRQQHIIIYGVGAVGRQLALLMSQLPLGSLTLMDPDTASPENLGPQGYHPSDVGLLKVAATASQCVLRNPSLSLLSLPYAATAPLTPDPLPTFGFLCVDKMSARASISKDCPYPLIDTRMASGTFHLLTRNPLNPDPYTSTLFPDSEMLVEPCTGRSTPWCASACASMAMNLWSQHLRRIEYPSHLICNLNSLELFNHAPSHQS